MCGIAGYLDPQASRENRETAVRRMCGSMLHRGPDDEGMFSEGPLTLGMRRLAIFDPRHGHQPMRTHDGRFTLIFNGAIYNFKILRGELERHGHRFQTECDTEVLLAAYVQWGESCLNRLRGMFAFAAWDSREQSLFLARDPFGIKPLYYAEPASGRFVFASEIRALLASGTCSDAVDPDAVRESLAYLAVPAPRTIYRGIRSLRPGECISWRAQKFSIRTYWTFHDAQKAPHDRCLTRSDFIAELRSRLEDSIRAHALADVPVGAFLSGGLDSNAVVGLMSRHQRTPLKTFAIGFDEAEYSEAGAAETAARHFGTQHQTYILRGEQVAADINCLVASFDQPTGDAINTFYVSRCARQGGVTVALSGLGGDELLGGYPWFQTTPRLAHLLPLWRILPATLRARVVGKLQTGDARQEKLADLLDRASNLHELAALQRRNFSERALQSLLRNAGDFQPHEELRYLPDELKGTGAFSSISAWEIRTYMADVLLRDSDVMSMQNSLELRVPFVDRPLLEWLWRQPDRFKRSARPKAALAEAVRDLLPAGIEQRPKQGFTLPFAQWMRGPLKPFLDQTFSTSSVERSGFFQSAGVQARWTAFVAGDDPREWSRIWSLAMLIAFLNRKPVHLPAV